MYFLHLFLYSFDFFSFVACKNGGGGSIIYMEVNSMEKKKNKGIIALIIVLIVIILGLSGYIVYDKVLKVEEPAIKEEVKESDEEVKETDFYSISELLKNNYIEKIETTETDYIKISDGKVFVMSDFDDDGNVKFEEIEKIEGKPRYVSFKSLCSDCTQLQYIILTYEGDVYYGFDDGESLSIPGFKKVNSEEVVNIYYNDLYQDKRFYAETINGDLLRVDKNGIVSSNTFKNDFKFVDYVYVPMTDGSIAYKLDKDGQMYIGEKLVEYKGVSIIAKEIVAMPYSENSLEEFTIKFYVISNENKIYFIDYPSGKENINLYSEKVVKNYNIDDSNDENVVLKIEYTDGTTEEIKNIWPQISTIYERNNK